MLMVGIRAANLPNAEELAVLLQFIYKKYELLSLGEIQLAFEKAVAGELDVEANCYENFSCEYVGRIMGSYKKWAIRQWEENQMHVVKPEPVQIVPSVDWSELGEMYYQDYLQGRFNISVMPAEIYEAAMKYGYMSVDAYEDWLSSAKEMLLSELYVDLSNAVNEKDRHDITEKLRKIKNDDLYFKVVEMAKKMAVELLYKRAKHEKIKRLF